MKKLIQGIGPVKKKTLFQDAFFLYDKRIGSKNFISESNEYVAIYGSMYHFNERKEDNSVNPITLIDKLSFSI